MLAPFFKLAINAGTNVSHETSSFDPEDCTAIFKGLSLVKNKINNIVNWTYMDFRESHQYPEKQLSSIMVKRILFDTTSRVNFSKNSHGFIVELSGKHKLPSDSIPWPR